MIVLFILFKSGWLLFTPESIKATFTEEPQNINQQQKKSQPIEAEVNHKDITEEKKDDSENEDVLAKDDKPSEEIESGPEDREEETPKKGFWSRFFGS